MVWVGLINLRSEKRMRMKDLTPPKTNPKLIMGLTIVAGLYMLVCFVLALDGILEWRFTLIGFLCLISLLLTWRPWKKDNGIRLDSEQKRALKAISIPSLGFIIGYPLSMWITGKLDSWKDALAWLGGGLVFALVTGVFFVLGSKIPKKDD